MATVKGQNLRIFLGNRVLAMSLTCSVEIGTILKEISNKDCVGGWVEQRVVGQNWNVKAQSVVCDDIDYGVTPEELKEMVGTTVQVDFAIASGEHNATKGDMLVTGFAILSDVNFTAEKRQRGLVDVTLTGTGRIYVPRLLADSNGLIFITSDGYALAV